MVTIAIKAEEHLALALESVAKQQNNTLENIIKKALEYYLQTHVPKPKTYSFIGIGHSGQKNLSTQVEQTLAKAANHREGWSLAE